MSIIAIIQARMTSTRLPGKILKPALGRAMLDHQLERTRRCRELDGIMIATTTNATDDPVVELCERLDVPVHRGSEHDVLSRYHEAAVKAGADIVVRMTSDCPVIDPQVSDMVIRRFLDHDPPLDYVTSGIPRSWPVGLDTEVMRFSALDTAFREADDPYDREHVSPFIYRQPNRFRALSVVSEEDLSHYRWTLDEPQDYELLRRIIEALYPEKPDFGYRDVIALLTAHPEWMEINASANQKPRRWEKHTFTGALADRPLEMPE